MDDEKNIIRYLDGEMTEDERLAFEREISGNPGLAEKVQSIRSLQEMAGRAVRRDDDPEGNLDPKTREEIRKAVAGFKEGRDAGLPEEVKQTIASAREAFEHKRESSRQATDLTEPERRQSNIRQIWYSAAAVVILAMIVTVLILRAFRDRPAGDLYAKYYREYPVSSDLSELSRSDDDLLFAIKVYEAGDYDRAVILLEMLSDSSNHGKYSRFYAGHAYLHLNDTDRAIATFRELLDSDPGELLHATRWYLALSYLRKGDAVHSREQLSLIEKTDSPFRKRAGMLLRDLQ